MINCEESKTQKDVLNEILSCSKGVEKALIKKHKMTLK